MNTITVIDAMDESLKEDYVEPRIDLSKPRPNPLAGKPRRLQTRPENSLTAADAVGFVVCMNNGGFEDALIPKKIYPVLPDENAAQFGWTRIVDENGEDMKYRSTLFYAIALPAPVQAFVRDECLAA